MKPQSVIPLTELREAIEPRPITPADLAHAGHFLILSAEYDILNRIRFRVELLYGERRGAVYSLFLSELDYRCEIVRALRGRFAGYAIGPCILRARYMLPDVALWSICAVQRVGDSFQIVYDPLGSQPDDPPAPGTPPVKIW